MELSEGPYNYPTLVSRDGGIKTRSVTTTEEVETFGSQLKGIFTNEIENNVFDEEVKTDVDAELDQPIARARLNFQKVIPFDPDIHPDRIRFTQGKDVTRTTSPTKSYAISFLRSTSFSRICSTSASSTAITLGPGREHRP